ncbi:MAG TPA: porin family protein [Chitinophagaceae bacterium]|nr:porin family protein [Chitinophagaceae bacterium]
MKKILLITLFATSIFIAKGQVYVEGGVNLANITKTTSGETQHNNLLTTFNAGVLGRFGISSPVDLESGLIFEGRGAKANTYFGDTYDDNYIKTKFNPLYLEVPLNLVLRFPIEKDANLFVHVGPYAAMGIAGKSTSETKIAGATSNSSSSIKFSNDDPFTSQQDDAAYDKLKRFDFGFNIGGGLDLGKIILRANYGYGFAKINSTQSDNSADDKNKYRTVSISVGLPLK